MHLANVIAFLKQTDELIAAKNLLNTFAKYANSLQQYDELGMLFEQVKAYPESLQMLEKCISLTQNDDQKYSIYANFAKVYNHLNNPDMSIYYSNLILQKFPNDFEAKMELSFSHYLKNEIETSYNIQKQLLSVPNLPANVANRIRFNMGSFELMRGHFKSGMKNMIFGGRDIKIYPQIPSPFPRWNGNKDTKATVVVYAESGIGDEIINIRFMKEFEKYGIKAVWSDIRKDMSLLFRRNGYNTIDNINELPKGDYVMCEAMSLPILLDVEQSELWNGPYLQPSVAHIEKWKKLLPEKFMTVRWSGNPFYDQDLHRTVNKDDLIPILQKYDMPLVSLQIDSKGADDRLIDVDIESWEDTLAIQYLAFMNVTSCTSTGHSASSIGASCIILPPIATYYTWLPLKPDNTSYWYGSSTKVYPQKIHKDWSDPIRLTCEYIEAKLNDEVRKNSSLHNSQK